jgi:MoxR-like ATPase
MSTPLSQIKLALLANVPVVWWGLPGVGKTALCARMTDDLSASTGLPFKFISTSGAYLDPADVGGIPFPGADDGAIQRRHDRWVQEVCDGPCVLLVDELNRAVRPSMNALLRMMQERLVGDRPLHPDTRLIFTANPPSVDPTAQDLGSAAANRVVHVHGPPSLEEWLDWLAPRSRGAGLVSAFLRTRPSFVDITPKAQERGGAWPSRRSWTNAAAILDAGFSVGDMNAALAAIEGTVGAGAGLEFAQFILSQDLPDPAVIMADPGNFPIPGRMDILFAATSGLVTLAHQRFDAAAYRATETWLLRLADSGARDVGANYLTTLLGGPRDTAGNATGRQPSGFAISPKSAQVYMPVLKAAGVIK